MTMRSKSKSTAILVFNSNKYSKVCICSFCFILRIYFSFCDLTSIIKCSMLFFIFDSNSRFYISFYFWKDCVLQKNSIFFFSALDIWEVILHIYGSPSRLHSSTLKFWIMQELGSLCNFMFHTIFCLIMIASMIVNYMLYLG